MGRDMDGVWMRLRSPVPPVARVPPRGSGMAAWAIRPQRTRPIFRLTADSPPSEN